MCFRESAAFFPVAQRQGLADVAGANEGEELAQRGAAELQQTPPHLAFDLVHGPAFSGGLAHARLQVGKNRFEVFALENVRFMRHAHRGPPCILGFRRGRDAPNIAAAITCLTPGGPLDHYAIDATLSSSIGY